MNVDNELTDYGAAGSLAEELPWWGWLEDGRSCLTRAGELMSIGRMTPSVLDGQTPEQLDRVMDRWQRMLSGVDSRTRLYFYLLRRPIQFARTNPMMRSIERGRARSAKAAGFPSRSECRSVSAYVAWAHDPGSIRRHHSKDRRAVVDGHCQELDGAAAEPAEFRLPSFLYRIGGRPASGS